MIPRLVSRLVFASVVLALCIIATRSLEAAPSTLPSAPSTIYLPFIVRTVAGPTLGGCPVFPADNVWNARIDSLPIDSKSATYINTLGGSTALHPDFGTVWNGGPIGIPYNIVPNTQPNVQISFYYPSQSDAGPYPIPSNAQIEYGSDHHILVVQSGTCRLYEVYDASTSNNGASWNAGSGAKWDLNSNVLRPADWTSADAAGLPILPGLVRYDEVMAGEIKHAIRFTVHGTNNTYIWPARHRTYHNYDANLPPMGQRFRLKASFNISTFPSQVQVILTAFKRYGIIVADNGSDWYISGAPDSRWDDGMLVDAFRLVHGSDFEAVDESSIMVNPDSGQVRQ